MTDIIYCPKEFNRSQTIEFMRNHRESLIMDDQEYRRIPPNVRYWFGGTHGFHTSISMTWMNIGKLTEEGFDCKFFSGKPSQNSELWAKLGIAMKKIGDKHMEELAEEHSKKRIIVCPKCDCSFFNGEGSWIVFIICRNCKSYFNFMSNDIICEPLFN